VKKNIFLPDFRTFFSQNAKKILFNSPQNKKCIFALIKKVKKNDFAGNEMGIKSII
jgi:hypothetical protein